MKNLFSPTSIYVGGAIFVYLGSLFVPEAHSNADLVLADAAKVSLDYFSETSKMIAGLATAVVGGCGALVVKGVEWSARWTRLDATLIVLALLAATTSLYGVYLGHMAALQMVASKIFDPFQSRLGVAISIQYYGLLIGVFLLGLVFTRMLGDRKSPSSSISA